jgi:formate dehydrogenase maturation protein FdhE
MLMDKITIAVKKEAYIENPNVCPYCQTDSITVDSIEANDYNATREIRCNVCKKHWTEILTVTDVVLYDEDDNEI